MVFQSSALVSPYDGKGEHRLRGLTLQRHSESDARQKVERINGTCSLSGLGEIRSPNQLSAGNNREWLFGPCPGG